MIKTKKLGVGGKFTIWQLYSYHLPLWEAKSIFIKIRDVAKMLTLQLMQKEYSWPSREIPNYRNYKENELKDIQVERKESYLLLLEYGDRVLNWENPKDATKNLRTD